MLVKNININLKNNKQKICLTIGNFDGVHYGHQELIKRLIKESKKSNFIPAVLSFVPHPRNYFNKQYENFNIFNEKKKKSILESYGIKILYKLKFNKKVVLTSPKDFVDKFLIKKLNVKSIIVGENFRFGSKRKGDINLLKKYSKDKKFNLHIINLKKITSKSNIISSSLIREHIKKGHVNKIKKLMGSYWEIEGKVVKGDKRARTMGFPTANIIPNDYISPKNGVYAVKIIHDNMNFKGIANFGMRPTFKGNKLLLEVNIFNLKKNIYGEKLTIKFVKFIRGEKKFNNINQLKKQIKLDILSVKSFFN